MRDRRRRCCRSDPDPGAETVRKLPRYALVQSATRSRSSTVQSLLTLYQDLIPSSPDRPVLLRRCERRTAHGGLGLQRRADTGNVPPVHRIGVPAQLQFAGCCRSHLRVRQSGRCARSSAISTAMGATRSSIYRPSQAGSTSATRGQWRGEHSFAFGDVGDMPIVGDFDGDGVDTVGIYRTRQGGFIALRTTPAAGTADLAFHFGVPGDQIMRATGMATAWIRSAAIDHRTERSICATTTAPALRPTILQVGRFRSAVSAEWY